MVMIGTNEGLLTPKSLLDEELLTLKSRPTPKSLLITRSEGAEMLRISVREWDRLVARGVIPRATLDTGHLKRWRRDAILGWLDRLDQKKGA
jgi:hypothetical protein